MISIQTGMLVALGFLLASLVWLLLASAFWSRAVRLTTERIKRSMPVSEPEIKADRDRLRAEYAIRVHKLETTLEHAKLDRARQLIEINRRDASISALETDVVTIRSDLDENLNARRVLEQTVADRLPKVEARLAEAKRLLFNRDREIAELAQGAKRHKQALEEVSSSNAEKLAQIERLNSALTTRGRRGKDEPQGEAALRSEAEALRTKTREQATLIDRLQRRLGHGYVVPGPAPMPGAAAEAPASLEGATDAARENLSEAQAALDSARAPAPAAATPLPGSEGEIRALKARAEDQAGEIARLKAALAAFEQTDQGSGLKNSKLALKARAGSAEAQAERQAATIGRLRGELAAAHERLARQAAHFMDEMRRIGSGPTTAGGPARNRDGERRKLVERVAHVRPALSPEKPKPSGTAAAAVDKPNGAEAPPGNGHDAKRESSAPAVTPSAAPADLHAATGSNGNGAKPVGGSPPAQAPAATPAVSASAAEMPQTATIPGRRKLRLLDRITGLAKN